MMQLSLSYEVWECPVLNNINFIYLLIDLSIYSFLLNLFFKYISVYKVEKEALESPWQRINVRYQIECRSQKNKTVQLM